MAKFCIYTKDKQNKLILINNKNVNIEFFLESTKKINQYVLVVENISKVINCHKAT